MPTRFTITFTGRVQGVNFRWTACRVAERFNVAGWVRNEPDGSVRCLVEGDRGELDGFVKAVEEAMAGCIRDSRINTEEPGEALQGFSIRY